MLGVLIIHLILIQFGFYLAPAPREALPNILYKEPSIVKNKEAHSSETAKNREAHSSKTAPAPMEESEGGALPNEGLLQTVKRGLTTKLNYGHG